MCFFFSSRTVFVHSSTLSDELSDLFRQRHESDAFWRDGTDVQRRSQWLTFLTSIIQKFKINLSTIFCSISSNKFFWASVYVRWCQRWSAPTESTIRWQQWSLWDTKPCRSQKCDDIDRSFVMGTEEASITSNYYRYDIATLMSRIDLTSSTRDERDKNHDRSLISTRTRPSKSKRKLFEFPHYVDFCLKLCFVTRHSSPICFHHTSPSLWSWTCEFSKNATVFSSEIWFWSFFFSLCPRHHFSRATYSLRESEKTKTRALLTWGRTKTMTSLITVRLLSNFDDLCQWFWLTWRISKLYMSCGNWFFGISKQPIFHWRAGHDRLDKLNEISSEQLLTGVLQRRLVLHWQCACRCVNIKFFFLWTGQGNMATIRQSFQGGTNKKDTESHWRSTILAKGKSCFFDRIAFERHDFSATKAELLQNAKHWVLHLSADGPQRPLRQRPEFAVALKQCLKVQDAHVAETRQSLRPIRPEQQQRQRKDQQFEGGENFDDVDRKAGWRYYTEPRGDTSVQHSSITARTAHSMRLVQDQAWFASSFVAQNKFCHLVCPMSHPWLFSHAPSSMSTSSSSPTYSTTQWEHSVHLAHLQVHSVDKLCHQESLWREDLQSVGKPRAQQLPHVMSPKQVATVSRIEAYSGDPCQVYDVQKILEKKITELLSPKKWRNLVRRFRGKHCRFWSRRWRITKDADFATVCPESFVESRCSGHTGERGECSIHSSRSKGKFEVSFIWRPESFGETRCIVFIWTGKLDQDFCVQKRQSVEFERISSWR